MKIFRINSWLLVVMVAFFLSGCMGTPGIRSGTPIELEQLEKIQPGKTTKHEVFEWIGPPMSVASRNKFISIPAPFQWDTRIALSPQSSESWFELFSSGHEFNEYHRVYYFYNARSKKKSVFLVVGQVDNVTTDFDKLWILVNEKTGIVEDYKVKKEIPEGMTGLLKILFWSPVSYWD